MKAKDKKEINTKNIKELKTMLKEAKDKLFSLNIEKSQNKLKNTSSIFLKRKEIARILTAIRREEIINEKSI
ncbi:MAG: 50S ribosomal protein L29 [Candidatus Levybacteria bacterium RIFCSPLOWO2_02_FULL_36_8b]|nr:MAG: 50S ribosomal protein L29 [Candidatus Levybacteria bacterium RIFCSPLOWO2_02_FULL_36_8b]